MSSSQPFLASSPASSIGRRRKSRFTFKHLAQLALSSTACPLRVIAHIDLDAFYAQCEMVRLGVPEDQPLAVQQWQGLIAINYPARNFDLSRHVTITEAQQKCPQIIMQHVATWREGDEKWQYHEDAFKNIATHKVSLDPYRRESKKILTTIKEALPAPPLQKVEKASVDEVFLDLSTQVHSILLERYPELRGPPPYDDPTERLPAPPTTALDWKVDALVDLDEDQTEEEAPDWNDVALCIASEIVRDVRAVIREKLKYTCSAGVARNKMLAKLGSAHKKPNQQTVIRNRAVQHFLSTFKFTKIRNLGGKLGDEVVNMFSTDTVKDLLEVPLEQLKKLGDDTGMWIYQIIRGEDNSEVNPRTQIKSMLSAKSFRPSINTFEQAVRWLRIFVADIYSRLVEEGITENKRRPKTINLHHRQGAQTRSKQAPIPQGRPIDENLLFDLAKNLLAQVIVDGRAWPCANLSLSVGGFEDGPTGNHGIGGFLVRGDEAKAMRPTLKTNDDAPSPANDEHPTKRRRVNDVAISNFFQKQESSDGIGLDREDLDFDDLPSGQRHSSGFPLDEDSVREDDSTDLPLAQPHIPDLTLSHADNHDKKKPLDDEDDLYSDPVADIENDGGVPITKFTCARCHKNLLVDQKEEHEDWHFAQDLYKEEQARLSTVQQPKAAPPPARGQKSTRGKANGKAKATSSTTGSTKIEKGQSRLAFGH